MMSRATIDRIKDRHPIEDVIAKAGIDLKPAKARRRYGPCFCDPKKGKAPLWINTESQTWGCFAAGSTCGGDVFTFLERQHGWDWPTAIKALVFDGAVIDDPVRAAELEAERKQRIADRKAESDRLAEEEWAKAHAIWCAGVPIAGTLVEAYFAHRGLATPATRVPRFSPAEPYWHDRGAAGGGLDVLHRGPCLLAAIQGVDGRFIGLHRTWLDPRLAEGTCPAEAPGKAVIRLDGETLTPKKMRGAKQGGAIRLHDDDGRATGMRVLLAGEGIETVETVYQACRARAAPGVSYYAYAAGDLGNLSGGGLGPSALHPSGKGWVPPSEPDPDAPGLMPPAWVDSAILLGDADSDPVITRARLACAQARWDKAGVPTGIAMAAPGRDFNDMVRLEKGAARGLEPVT